MPFYRCFDICKGRLNDFCYLVTELVGKEMSLGVELVENWGILGLEISIRQSRNEGMKDTEEEEVWSESKVFEFTIFWGQVVLDDDKGSDFKKGVEHV